VEYYAAKPFHKLWMSGFMQLDLKPKEWLSSKPPLDPWAVEISPCARIDYTPSITQPRLGHQKGKTPMQWKSIPSKWMPCVLTASWTKKDNAFSKKDDASIVKS
jgi:hypothetical protein